MPVDEFDAAGPHSALPRRLGLPQAVSLNVANMVGIGPFITIPLLILAMNGPQSVVAWVLAGILVLCDGLIWSELGAALPGSGGSYHFLKDIYGSLHPTWGRLVPFLFIWQFLVSGTLEAASGFLGAKDYLLYIYPNLERSLALWHIPGGANTLAAAACVLVTVLLCRPIHFLGWLSLLLCAGVFAALLAVIVSGLPHFSPHLLALAENAPRGENAGGLTTGLGKAMTYAIYTYFGYYNICYLGAEVRNPGKTIPRAVIGSIVIVGVLYLLMHLAIISVIPWEKAKTSTRIASDFMQRLYGRPKAVMFTWLVVWTAIAGVFAMLLGYSRIPFAAARRGDFFAIFGRLHPRGQYPVVSIAVLGGLTAACCYAPLQQVIDGAVAVRILVQFIGQIVGLHLLRKLRPDVPLPFRMRLYPLPSLIALAGWLFVLATTDPVVLAAALGVTAIGLPVFFAWKARSPLSTEHDRQEPRTKRL